MRPGQNLPDALCRSVVRCEKVAQIRTAELRDGHFVRPVRYAAAGIFDRGGRCKRRFAFQRFGLFAAVEPAGKADAGQLSIFAKGDRCKIPIYSKGISADLHNAIGNMDGGEYSTIIECVFRDLLQALGNLRVDEMGRLCLRLHLHNLNRLAVGIAKIFSN